MTEDNKMSENERLVMCALRWGIEKKEWPWNESHGPNQKISIFIGDMHVGSISVCEVIEAAGSKFVSAHLDECKKELKGFIDAQQH